VSTETPVISLSERRGLVGYVSDLWRRREFAWHLAMGNMRGRHASTSLGLLWWVLDPLLLGGIFLLVFGVILQTRRGDPNFIGFILSGLFAFFFTRRTMLSGSMAIRNNSRMVATQRFPRLLLPTSAIIEGAIAFLFSLIPFFVIAGGVNNDWPGAFTVWLIPAFVFHTIFNFGLTLLVAQLVIPFRDIENVMNYVARVWMYLSPVVYSLDDRLSKTSDTVGALLYDILRFNPLVPLLGLYRHALLGGQLCPTDTVCQGDYTYPLNLAHVWAAAVWAVAIAIVGVVTFVRMEDKIPRYLA
jgi:teichoic acid transport system permease protein